MTAGAAAPAAVAVDSSEAGYAAFQGTRTFGALDGLRGISILAVLWHHTDHPADPLFQTRGFLGVDLFFVISGFLIVTLLLRERVRTGEISLRGFYIRRLLRIFPPYYLMLAVVAATALLKPGHGSAGILEDLPFALLYVSNMVSMKSLLTITWSLSTEEQFYLVVPALEKHARRVIPWLLPVAYVVLSLPPFGVWPWLHLPAFFRETTFGPILLGVMLAHLLHDRRAFAAAWRVLRHPAAPVAALALLVLALQQPQPDISGWPRILIHWAMAILVASCVIREDHLLAAPLRFWPLRRIGAVSYGIYLYHMMVWFFVNRAMARVGVSSQPVFFLANTVGSWAVAELSYRWFESRVLALKSRFAA